MAEVEALPLLAAGAAVHGIQTALVAKTAGVAVVGERMLDKAAMTAIEKAKKKLTPQGLNVIVGTDKELAAVLHPLDDDLAELCRKFKLHKEGKLVLD